MNSRKAFTLLELLVVISIVAILVTISVPSLARARLSARGVVCRSNIRQLVISNLTYSQDNREEFVLAASDIMTTNLNRWHGTRTVRDDPFDSLRGPLAAYLGNGTVKQCPQKTEFRHHEPWDMDFEEGCGGYGYNMTYVGSRIWQEGFGACDRATMQSEVTRPQTTVMFTDAAMSKLDNGTPYYLEYSFVEPPFFVTNGHTQPDWGYASPSIHFRHVNRAGIGWADGHVEARSMADFPGVNVYGVNSSQMNLGWFEPLDNRMFDLE